ncbi:hypothetical protein FWG95_03925 [Candidatus Saccharibacteria bacterium]|nr:hypothetical protein [Candidatus Saccharibacteria bacterium]
MTVFQFIRPVDGAGSTGTCLPTSKGGTGCDAAATMGFLKSEMVNTLYPVGSIIITTTNTNPGGNLGGTWAQFGQGRTLLGVGSNAANSNTTYGSMAAGTINRTTAEETSGVVSHTLTTAQMPGHTHAQDAHTHTQNSHSHNVLIGSTQVTWAPLVFAAGGNQNGINTTGTGGNVVTNGVTATNQNTTATNQNTGGGGAHNNVQPYITVYFWKRTN